MKKITVQQLSERLHTKKTTVIDVRSEDKFSLKHLEHANADTINVPKTNIFTIEDGVHAELPFSKDEEIIITCTTGNSATRCGNILSEQGYNVIVLEGGMTAWNKEIKE